MLCAKNLTKVYKTNKQKWLWFHETREVKAVDSVSIDLEPGKIVGLLGVNGAGKTTLIKMLATLIEPTSGEFTVNGIDGINNHREVKKIINMITGGERNLYWQLSARENLEYFGALYNIPTPTLKQRIYELLELVHLTEVMDVPVEQYSKGMKQRLQFARGLINDPFYLLLDEPTLGLDISIAKEIRTYVKELARKRNKGIMLTSHYIKEVEELSDYIYVIHKGQIVASGSPDELKHAIKNEINATIFVNTLSEPEKIKILQIVNGLDSKIVFDNGDKGSFIRITSSQKKLGEIIQVLSSFNIKIEQMKITESSLEDSLVLLMQGR